MRGARSTVRRHKKWCCVWAKDMKWCWVWAQALSGKFTLAALQETLAEAAGKGAGATRLADGLRARIADAEAWDARAGALLAPSGARVPLEALEVHALCCTLKL